MKENEIMKIISGIAVIEKKSNFSLAEFVRSVSTLYIKDITLPLSLIDDIEKVVEILNKVMNVIMSQEQTWMNSYIGSDVSKSSISSISPINAWENWILKSVYYGINYLTDTTTNDIKNVLSIQMKDNRLYFDLQNNNEEDEEEEEDEHVDGSYHCNNSVNNQSNKPVNRTQISKNEGIVLVRDIAVRTLKYFEDPRNQSARSNIIFNKILEMIRADRQKWSDSYRSKSNNSDVNAKSINTAWSYFMIKCKYIIANVVYRKNDFVSGAKIDDTWFSIILDAATKDRIKKTPITFNDSDGDTTIDDDDDNFESLSESLHHCVNNCNNSSSSNSNNSNCNSNSNSNTKVIGKPLKKRTIVDIEAVSDDVNRQGISFILDASNPMRYKKQSMYIHDVPTVSNGSCDINQTMPLVFEYNRVFKI